MTQNVHGVVIGVGECPPVRSATRKPIQRRHRKMKSAPVRNSLVALAISLIGRLAIAQTPAAPVPAPEAAPPAAPTPPAEAPPPPPPASVLIAPEPPPPPPPAAPSAPITLTPLAHTTPSPSNPLVNVTSKFSATI